MSDKKIEGFDVFCGAAMMAAIVLITWMAPVAGAALLAVAALIVFT